MKHVERIDAARLRVDCGRDISALLFANEQVDIDRRSIDDIRAFAELSSTVGRVRERYGAAMSLGRLALTPDFHRGAAMPVGTVAETHGFVIPHAAGNDIGCGMSLAVLGIEADEVARTGPALDAALRHLFFEGGRDIRVGAETRRRILVEGVAALAQAGGALAEGLGPAGAAAAARSSHRGGTLPGARVPEALEDWIAPGGRTAPTRDSFLGTIGGGNHFVEIQRVDEIVDRRAAHAWGLRAGAAAIMVHSGSLSLGSAVALQHREAAARIWPADMRRPENRILPLPLDGPLAQTGRDYLADMNAAANFATANRLFLSRMAAQALERVLGRRIGWTLVHDLPHNLAWHEAGRVVHRKGACPAERDEADPVFLDGSPVIVPGSMGAASWLLRGLGSPESLASAPHGAGRVLSRNAGRAAAEEAPLRIVTRIDLATARGDIAREVGRSLAEEAPRAYKAIGPVIDTVAAAGIAQPVARLSPILTVKG
jgi:tRNA-splicing ligase RtcB (3'-phosphate/5'-hydroxy nucleic acid ligase)